MQRHLFCLTQGTMASAGKWHTVLRRSDGEAVACGLNSAGQCSIPPLDEGISYCQVSGGDKHTVLLRSDGQAIACGCNEDGRCSMPPLDEGISYTQVSAGAFHTVLLRSDGQALLAVVTTMDNAPFQRWMKVCHTARYLQEKGTRCFSEVMAKQ